jgi:hypothetical protein
VLEDGDELLILTKGVRSNPMAARLADLNATFDSHTYSP